MIISKYSVGFLVLALLIQGCGSSGPVKISESDKLTKAEEQAVVKYSRGMLLNAKRLKLSTKERLTIKLKKPNVKYKYSGHKKGTMWVSWSIMGRKKVKKVPGATMQIEERRIVVIYEGNLASSTGRSVRISLANTSNTAMKELQERHRRIMQQSFIRQHTSQ